MSLDIYLHTDDGQSIDTDVNLTHNLGAMAKAAGVYEALWRPYLLTNPPTFANYDEEREYEEATTVRAIDLIPYLTEGLLNLLSNSSEFSKLNPSNGWGSYEVLVQQLCKYIAVCHEHPTLIVKPCR